MKLLLINQTQAVEYKAVTFFHSAQILIGDVEKKEGSSSLNFKSIFEKKLHNCMTPIIFQASCGFKGSEINDMQRFIFQTKHKVGTYFIVCDNESVAKAVIKFLSDFVFQDEINKINVSLLGYDESFYENFKTNFKLEI